MKRARRAALCALIVALPGAARAQGPADAPADAPVQTAPAPPPEIAGQPTLPTRLADAAGTWDLSRDGSNRRCVMTLSLDSGAAGRRLAFPAGCRRALPVVAPMAGWLFADGVVRLVDRDVRPVLQFTKRPDGHSLVAQSESGESFSLVPLDIAGMRPPETARFELPAATPGAGPSAEPAALAPPARADSMAGTYALDRFQDRDTCRIRLDPAGTAARIAEGCRDAGIEVFDPARWHYADGRLTLTARRGHSIGLVPGGDGRWRRDPEVGTTFVLRRVEP